MQIRESAEDYLEAILIIKNDKGICRSTDIANFLGYSKPSVSIAMKSLRDEFYITTDKNNNIELTDKGLEIAEKIYEKHFIIAEALIKIGVDENVAYRDSCKMEHAISDESFAKLKEHIMKYIHIDKK